MAAETFDEVLSRMVDWSARIAYNQDSRDWSMVRTKLEEAYMWMNKAELEREKEFKK